MKATDFPLNRITDLISDLHQATDSELAHARQLRREGQAGSRERLESALAYSSAAHLVNRAYLLMLGDLDRAAAHEQVMQTPAETAPTPNTEHPWPIDGLERLGGTERNPEWGVRTRLGTRVLLFRSAGDGRLGLRIEERTVSLKRESWEALAALAQRILAGEPIPWGKVSDLEPDEGFTE